VSEPDRLRTQPLGRKLAGWWVLVGVLTLLAYSSNFSGGDPPDDLLYRYESAAIGVLLYGVVLGVLLLIAKGLDLREAFGLRRPHSWSSAVGWALGLLVAMLVLAAALEPIGGEEQGLDPPGWRSDRALAFALNALVIAGAAPLVEELMYRGLGFTLLSPLGVAAAIVVIGISFALAHGLFRAFPVLFVIGAGLAFLRWRTGSVYPPIILHACFNGVGLVVGVLTSN
jgi:membrane protease YdiL (CAAX protease family)